MYPSSRKAAAVQPLNSPQFIIRAAASSFGGLLLGIMISLIVNCTLLEISLNGFFATYFGVLFIGVGMIILWRIKMQPQENEQRELFLVTSWS